MSEPVRWDHPLWFQDHPGRPDLSQQYIQRGTGNTEAPCLDCGMAVIARTTAPVSAHEGSEQR